MLAVVINHGEDRLASGALRSGRAYCRWDNPFPVSHLYLVERHSVWESSGGAARTAAKERVASARGYRIGSRSGASSASFTMEIQYSLRTFCSGKTFHRR